MELTLESELTIKMLFLLQPLMMYPGSQAIEKC